MKLLHCSVAIALITLVLVPPGYAQPNTPQHDAPVANVTFAPPAPQPRYLVFISDLHLGIGRGSDGSWHPTEDFRWPSALQGFLNEIARRGDGKTDLVIVGDFLEMWQPPKHIRCAGVSANLGCTLAEMETLAELIAEQHKTPLEA